MKGFNSNVTFSIYILFLFTLFVPFANHIGADVLYASGIRDSFMAGLAQATDNSKLDEQSARTANEPGDFHQQKMQKDNLEVNLKVIKHRVNIREAPDPSSNIIGLVKENDIIIGVTEKDGWYKCRTPQGEEGWIIDWACELIPIHYDSIKTKKGEIIIKTNDVQVRAGPDEGFPVLGVLSMGKEVDFYIKKAGWIYIKEMDSQIEGWITSRSAYDSKRHIDLTAWKNNIFKISTKLSSYYDKKKLDIRAFKDTGYYPSLVILQKGRDIKISPFSEGWRLKLVFSVRYVSVNTLFPLSMETTNFLITKTDRLFFLVLIQALMENAACEEIELVLRGLKIEKGGDYINWVTIESFSISRAEISGVNLDRIDPDVFWGLLKQH